MNGLACKLVGKLIPIPVPFGASGKDAKSHFFQLKWQVSVSSKNWKYILNSFSLFGGVSMLGHMSSDTL